MQCLDWFFSNIREPIQREVTTQGILMQAVLEGFPCHVSSGNESGAKEVMVLAVLTNSHKEFNFEENYILSYSSQVQNYNQLYKIKICKGNFMPHDKFIQLQLLWLRGGEVNITMICAYSHFFCVCNCHVLTYWELKTEFSFKQWSMALVVVAMSTITQLPTIVPYFLILILQSADFIFIVGLYIIYKWCFIMFFHGSN